MALDSAVTLDSLGFAVVLYLAFVVALFAAAKVLPGRTVQGFAQIDGERLRYKVNGMALWVATHIFVVTGTVVLDLSLSPLLTHFWSLFIVANVVSALTTVWLFSRGARKTDDAVPLQGLWYGVELNPRLWGVDLKTFAYQPSLIGLGILNVAFAFAQYEQLGTLTPQMWAYQVFWWLYLTTHYHYEVGVLSMWDVIAEKFGFMLVWGDLVLVPFFYSIGGWWLLGAQEPFSIAAVAGLVALHVVGLSVFRGANAQKDRFKRDPEAPIWGRPPETIGGRLLVSGWWGIGRKINYTGEICVYFSFALCTGFQSIVPYLLPLWLCVLLPHRAWRDEKRCCEKYGEVWESYTSRVRFKMVPFLY